MADREGLGEPIEWLLDAVEADPLAIRRVVVKAPGGYGKTAILDSLRERYRRAGIEVVGLEAVCRQSIHVDPAAAAVFVDDAHRVGEPELRRLGRLRLPRLALACRPWPYRAGVDDLLAAPDVVLLEPGPLDAGRVARLLGRRWDAEPPSAFVDFVHAQTGGVPRFVERVASALPPPLWSGAECGRLPDPALAGFRVDIDLLDEDVLRYLLAVDAGAGRHPELLVLFLDSPPEAVMELAAAAAATGLLGQDGRLLPVARQALVAFVPAQYRSDARLHLAQLQLCRGRPVLGLARSLLGAELSGAAAPSVFRAAADEALAADPALAARLYAASTAGGEATGTAVRWAEAAFRCGDVDTALWLADTVLAGSVLAGTVLAGTVLAVEPSPDQAAAARVAAAALAHRGQLERSSQLHRWAGDQASLAFATVGFIGVGCLQEACRLSAADSLDRLPPVDLSGRPTTDLPSQPVTPLDRAAVLLAFGVHQSVVESGAEALPTLVRASTMIEPIRRTAMLPDSPAAIAALVALHCGELSLAESVLARAVAAGTGGDPLAARHRLLGAWVAMLRGAVATARPPIGELEPRDALFAAALDVGVARRAGDVPAMKLAWARAREALRRNQVDLFTLLPLGELTVAASQLRDEAVLAPYLSAAGGLLDALGEPPLWSAPLRWSRLHAAIIGERADDATAQTIALEALAARDGTGHVTALANAAACWVDVASGDFAAESVESAARGLRDAGLAWDGAQLAGRAALRTPDRATMFALLDCARKLQEQPPPDPHCLPGRPAPGAPPPEALSDRELAVARYVAAGLTYRQVGARLSISAKTVEHHIARIRRKLGCTSRAELLARLRTLT